MVRNGRETRSFGAVPTRFEGDVGHVGSHYSSELLETMILLCVNVGFGALGPATCWRRGGGAWAELRHERRHHGDAPAAARCLRPDAHAAEPRRGGRGGRGSAAAGARAALRGCLVRRAAAAQGPARAHRRRAEGARGSRPSLGRCRRSTSSRCRSRGALATSRSPKSCASRSYVANCSIT